VVGAVARGLEVLRVLGVEVVRLVGDGDELLAEPLDLGV
jgi:hypothetical protein